MPIKRNRKVQLKWIVLYLLNTNEQSNECDESKMQ